MTTGPDTDERARVAGYLNGQGERYTFTQLWPRVTAGRLELLSALDGVSEEQSAFKPADDEWSIREVAWHALNGSRGVQHLLAPLARGEAPPERVRVDPEREPTDMSIAELRQQLLEDSVEFGALVKTLREPASLEKTAPHMFFGDLHCRAWYLFQRVHDQDHARQIEGIKETAGYPAE
jgi:hypothetical protein